MWLFEQTQAIEAFDVYTPVRMTVIKLKSGGLWVHGPIAPTQVGSTLKELQHGFVFSFGHPASDCREHGM